MEYIHSLIFIEYMSATRIEDWQHNVLSTDYRLCAMSGSEICRKFSFGSSWNTLCVAFMADFDYSGSFYVDSPGIYFGLTSNNGSILQGSTPHWAGMRFAAPGGYALANTSYEYIYSVNSPQSQYVAISGSTLYSSSNSIAVAIGGYESSTQIGPLAFALVYEKNGSTMNVYALAGTVSSVTINPIDRPTFIDGINSGNTSSLESVWETDMTYVSKNTLTPLILKEAEYGYLDSVSLCMPNLNQRWKISGVAAKIWA